jgi:hypothetical protein
MSMESFDAFLTGKKQSSQIENLAILLTDNGINVENFCERVFYSSQLNLELDEGFWGGLKGAVGAYGGAVQGSWQRGSQIQDRMNSINAAMKQLGKLTQSLKVSGFTDQETNQLLTKLGSRLQKGQEFFTNRAPTTSNWGFKPRDAAATTASATNPDSEEGEQMPAKAAQSTRGLLAGQRPGANVNRGDAGWKSSPQAQSPVHGINAASQQTPQNTGTFGEPRINDPEFDLNRKRRNWGS